MSLKAPSTNIHEALRAVIDGDLVTARRILEQTVSLALFDPIARHDLAVVARLQGALSIAWTHADAAVSFAGDDAAVRAVMLSHRALLDRLMDARTDADAGIRAALEADPTHRVSLAYAGLFARLDGDLETAILRWSASLAPGRAPLLPQLVRARIVGMLADARAFGVRRIAPTGRCDSAIGAITELLAPDGAASLPDLGYLAASFALPDVLPAGEATPCPPAQAAEIIHLSRNIVVLTGAGCSAESGLATRKDLWKRFDKDDAVSITSGSFDALWCVVQDFVGDREARPNPAHDVIASLPRVRAIITQNVDDLHQRAARDDLDPVPVIELHGTLSRTHCHQCGADRGLSAQAVAKLPGPRRCPMCAARALRPSVVLFGECVPRAALEESARLVSECDLLIVVGCAMDVAPASELPRLAREHGAVVLEIKRGPSRLARSLETRWLAGTAATVLPELYGALATLEDVLPLRDLSTATLPALPPPREIVEVRFPSMGESNPDGVIVEWRVEPGATVTQDDSLFVIGLDKIDAEVPAPFTGRLAEVYAAAGDTVRVDQVVARMDVPISAATAASPMRWPTVLRERTRDRLSGEFAPWTGAVRVLLDQISRAPLLVPDSALAALDADAMAWVADRANELASALAVDDAPKITVFRDPFDAALAACERWAAVSSLDALAPWSRAWVTTNTPAEPPDARHFEDRIGPAVSRAAWIATSAMDARVPELAWKVRDVFDTVATHSVRSVAWWGPTPEPPCRWRPMLALWLRGAWPFVLPDALGLWVPLYRDGALSTASIPKEMRARLAPRLSKALNGEWLLPLSPRQFYR